MHKAINGRAKIEPEGRSNAGGGQGLKPAKRKKKRTIENLPKAVRARLLGRMV